MEEICGHLQLNASQLQLDRLQNVGDLQVVGFARPDTFDQYMSAFYTAGREVSVGEREGGPDNSNILFIDKICTI